MSLTPYYERDGITIYCGDCLEVMPQLEPGFDAVIADLPYGQTALDWDIVIPLEPLWENYKRLVKARGAVVLFGSQPFTSMLVMSNLKWFKYDWVWNKKMVTNIAAAKIQPLRSHESILVFSEGTSFYNPQLGEVQKPFGKLSISKSKVVTSSQLGTNYQVGVGYPKTILEVPRPNNLTDGGFHPTQKPVALMAYLIRTYTNPGDLVLDNAMGSGTTLVAAQNEGRRAVGIDISEEYCKIAVERLRQPSFFTIGALNGDTPAPTQRALFEGQDRN